MTTPQSISVLIIEDNQLDQLLLNEHLISTHLLISEAVIAETLAEGINHLNKQDFTIIFLDLFLPDSTGLDTFLELIKVNQRTPVVIHTGLTDTKIAINAIAAGAQDYLIKGDYTIQLLEKTIRYCIERKSNLEALEVSNARLDILSKATYDMVWDWNLVTGEEYRNPEGWKKIFRTPDGVPVSTTNADWISRIHPEDLDRVNEANNKVRSLNDNEVLQIDIRIIRDDGTIGYILDRGFISRDKEGKALRFTGATQDVTERKIAEQKVLLSEQRFKSLVQNSSDLLSIIDINQNFLYVSPTSKKILGYDPDSVMGKNIFSFIHEEDLPKTISSLTKICETRFLELPLIRFRNYSGEWRWLDSSVTNMIDNPAIEGIVINARDVTEKKIAADEIEKLSMIARETINAVIITVQDKIVWVNDAFTKMLGYSLKEIIGECPLNFLVGPATEPGILEYVLSQKTKKASFSFEIIIYTKVKHKIFVRIQMQPILNANGDVKNYFGLFTDITKEKEFDEKIALEKVIKQKEITDAVFTAQEIERTEIGRELHDNVNQLLGASRLYIDMARKDDVNRDSLLANSSSYTLTAIEEIRKVSKFLITPQLEEMGLIDTIKNLIEELRLVHPIRIVFNANNINEDELNYKFKLNVFRIVQEQINNTLKHAQAHAMHITIADNDESLSLSIADDGIGFDTAAKKAGVGLSNIKSRSQLYNGHVQLRSERGNGTDLLITFNKADLKKIYSKKTTSK